jgi:hypothetical protein
MIFLSLALSTGCKVAKYTPDKLPTRQLVFGNGGGFAGIETSFTLLENGQIFKQTGVEGAYEELKSIKPKEAKAFFEKLTSLQLYKLDIEKPGNLYYFLREVNEKLDSKVVWGAGDYLPPQGLISLYKDLQATTKGREGTKKISKAKKEEQGEKKKEEDEIIKW